jgi:hypothetical protein
VYSLVPFDDLGEAIATAESVRVDETTHGVTTLLVGSADSVIKRERKHIRDQRREGPSLLHSLQP